MKVYLNDVTKTRWWEADFIIANEYKFLLETNTTEDVWGKPLLINGKYYIVCMGSEKKEGQYIYVVVDEIKIPDDEESYGEDFKCPYCGAIMVDAYELSEDSSEYDCGCGATLEYEREYSCTYSISVKNKPNIIKL